MADIVCQSIYSIVKQIKEKAELLDHVLKEDARKLHRHGKRIEAVVSDLQPYYQGVTDKAKDQLNEEATEVLAGLHSVAQALAEARELLELAHSRGPLSTYLQADLLLQQFRDAMHDLDQAVAQLPCNERLLGSAYEETSELVERLRASLQRATFELPELHVQRLAMFREACNSFNEPMERMQDTCKAILQEALGHSCLNQDEFGVTVADLQKEIRQQWSRSLCGNNRRSQPSAVGDAEAALQQQQQPPREPALYLRMMVDLLRVTHTHQNAVPLEFICPLTTAIMIEPVLLHETGHSYERFAIEDWFASGKHLCPKSGVSLRRLNISPNHALKAAIRTWCEATDQQLRYRPFLKSCVNGTIGDFNHKKGSAPSVSRTSSMLAEAKQLLPQLDTFFNSIASGITNTISRRQSMPGGYTDVGSAAAAAAMQPRISCSQLSDAPHTPMNMTSDSGVAGAAAAELQAAGVNNSSNGCSGNSNGCSGSGNSAVSSGSGNSAASSSLPVSNCSSDAYSEAMSDAAAAVISVQEH